MAKIAIIGSGFGWLSSAIYCAHAWHDVTVYEKNEQLWWRASVLERNGFRWDMWPSWYLMPDLFEQYFAHFDLNVHDFLKLSPLDPSYKIYFWGTEKTIDVYKDIERNRETFEDIEPGSTDKLYEYLKISEYQYDIAMQDMVPKNYDSVFDFFTWDMMTKWTKMKVLSNLHSYVKKFFSSDMMQKIMEYTLVFLWTPPKKAPAMYNIMTHVDFNGGVRYPQGWINAVIQSLVSIATNKGVRFHVNSPVDKILVEWWVATWVEVEWDFIEYDIIISNADYHFTETKLLDTQRQTYPQTYRDKKMMAPSGFILYLGIKWKVQGLCHHTLIFSEDRDENFKDIFDEKKAPTDPSFYICCPSQTDPSVAPEWHENMFILVPFPPWVILDDTERKEYRECILSIVENEIGDSFVDRIVEEEYFGVEHFQERYNAFQGSALGLAHTLKQTAIFRPNTKSKKVRNLFYAGGYTNPWIGMPMCLISWQLAFERVKKYVNA